MDRYDTHIRNLLEQEVVGSGVSPCASAGFAVFRAGCWWTASAAAGRRAGEAAAMDTVYDLASVSKSFVAASVARKVRLGALSFESPLGALLPEVATAPAAARSLELLLSHRAGLLAHVPLFDVLQTGGAVRRRGLLQRAASSLRPGCNGPAPALGFPALYSDLGYLLAGEALACTQGEALDQVVHQEVSQPLGIDVGSARQWLASNARFIARVAPSEHVGFRGGLLRGVVHDENAWALAGHGLAGQAGLFGTVWDVLSFGRALLDALRGRNEQWLRSADVQHLVAERKNGSLRLGFDGKSGPAPSAGPSASAHSFGHLGFTGTSFWCDPVADSVTVLLTNRVCPTRENTRIREARPRVHEALQAWAGVLAPYIDPKGLVARDQP
ncbi:MAG TPA: serine hydrolase domain-containing protein [Polyangiaceae bacterium]|nr:serine hydrolase domain-containing protein [Polyangiaceae bacterium]